MAGRLEGRGGAGRNGGRDNYNQDTLYEKSVYFQLEDKLLLLSLLLMEIPCLLGSVKTVFMRVFLIFNYVFNRK